MAIPTKITLFCLLCLSAFFAARGQAINPTFTPKNGDRIVLIGNTFADRMRHYGYFETFLQKKFPTQQLTLRNMGWSADEVGLQPRPLNFPGFGENNTKQTLPQQEVTFKGFTHEGEKIVMPVVLNFAGLNQDLTEQKADILLLCFGMNEAFKGLAGISQFTHDLEVFINNLQSHSYNGRSAPTVVLVSPIAHENLGGYLPNPDAHNANLALYTNAIQKLATSKNLTFIDLFTPSLAYMKINSTRPITINGIHLNALGYRLAAEWMGQSLGFGKLPDFDSPNSQKLLDVIKRKDAHFFYRWRAVNGEYIYGRRREPFGVIAYPSELRKLNQMVTALDSVIWNLGKSNGISGYNKALEIVDRRGKPMDPMLVPTVAMTGRQGEAAHKNHGKMGLTTEKFKLPKGYSINLFASEKNFPVEKPVAMNFDARGRLWVATMPTYPQYFPGIPVHDKIVILEDTNGDGKADKHTVFADDLYLPLGFEFGNGGVYVSQEPDILFLKDTNGDDKADQREVILTGFGSEDSHHATHAFTYGQEGALYFNEGHFLNSQVETPYGPVRSYTGATYRYEPRTGKLSNYVSYPFYNPWGSVFDKWGTHLIGDASDGSNYFAPPMTGKVNYPDKHPRIDMFTQTRVRPTAGIEIVSSRQFPDAVQGDFLVNNNIGFQGTKQHRIIPKGSGITGQEVEPLLQSSDPNFRPIDLKFGPDGGLYIADWYNPLISHGENPPRDPARDKSHGRIWRITYKNRPLLKRTDVSKQTIPELLNNLKGYEDRFRYRSRIQIRERKPSEVIPELKKWMTNLDKNNPQYEHHLLEGLWLCQDFEIVDEISLRILLNAKEYQARAAATKVLLHWRDRIPNSLELMRKSVNDASPRVRLEAVVSLSFWDSEQAVTAALDVFQYPTDYYLEYAIRETFRLMKSKWLPKLKQGEQLTTQPEANRYLINLLTTKELLSLPQDINVLMSLLTRSDVGIAQKENAVNSLAEIQKMSRIDVLLQAIRSEKKQAVSGDNITQNELIRLLLISEKRQLEQNMQDFKRIIKEDSSETMRAISYAAILTVEQSDESVLTVVREHKTNLSGYLIGISFLTDPVFKASFYKKVSEFAPQLPAIAFPLLMKMTIDTEAQTQPTKDLLMSMEQLPQSVQNTEGFSQALAIMKNLTGSLAEKDQKEIIAILERMGTIEIKLTTVEAKMAFDKKNITVPSGRSISLIFDNPDLMPHNVVIIKPGSTEKVGQAADAMASMKDGFEKNFIPSTSDVLFATPLVNSGKSFRLDFKAPLQPGEYPFICSFPGHWQIMQGILTVTP